MNEKDNGTMANVPVIIHPSVAGFRAQVISVTVVLSLIGCFLLFMISTWGTSTERWPIVLVSACYVIVVIFFILSIKRLRHRLELYPDRLVSIRPCDPQIVIFWKDVDTVLKDGNGITPRGKWGRVIGLSLYKDQLYGDTLLANTLRQMAPGVYSAMQKARAQRCTIKNISISSTEIRGAPCANEFDWPSCSVNLLQIQSRVGKSGPPESVTFDWHGGLERSYLGMGYLLKESADYFVRELKRVTGYYGAQFGLQAYVLESTYAVKVPLRISVGLSGATKSYIDLMLWSTANGNLNLKCMQYTSRPRRFDRQLFVLGALSMAFGLFFVLLGTDGSMNFMAIGGSLFILGAASSFSRRWAKLKLSDIEVVTSLWADVIGTLNEWAKAFVPDSSRHEIIRDNYQPPRSVMSRKADSPQ